MKYWVFIFFLFFVPSVVVAKEIPREIIIDKETKELCNKIMLNIYHDILEAKDDYKELVDFGEDSFFENEHGIYSIIYESKDLQAVPGKRPVLYSFGITINKEGEEAFPDKRWGRFTFGFPAIGLKFSGYQNKHRLRRQFNVLPLLDKHGGALAEHQQNYLPLRLIIRTLEDKYEVKDKIEFEVVLRNVSKRHMIVKSLGSQTLYFLFNNGQWGTSASTRAQGGKDVVLKAGESLSMIFEGAGFQRPQEFEVYCEYRVPVNGVKPAGVLKVQVVE